MIRTTGAIVGVLRASVPNTRVSTLLVEVLREDTSPPPSPPPISVVQTIGMAAKHVTGQGALVLGSYIVYPVDNLSLESACGYNQSAYVVQYLGFTPRFLAYCSNGMFVEDEEAPLTGSHARILITENASNELGLLLGESVIQSHAISNAFNFTQVVTPQNYQTATNQFSLIAAADTSDTEFEQGFNQGTIKQHVTYKISGSPCIEKDFSPAVGSGTDNYPVMDTTEPVLAHADLTLTYPAITPTTTLALKNPVFGNTDNLVFQRVDRTTRGGDRIVYVDPTWPRDQVLDFQVENMSEEQAEAVAAFINESLGKLVGLLDWEGTQWQGIIVAPDTELVESVTGYSMKLRFQGGRT